MMRRWDDVLRRREDWQQVRAWLYGWLACAVLWTLVDVWFYTLRAQEVLPAAAASGDMKYLVYLAGGAALTQVITFATLMFNSRASRQREERNRKWEVEDRVALAAKVVDTSKALAVRVADTSGELKDTVKARTEHLATLIKDNTTKTMEATEAAHEAYKEANNVNIKISDLNERLIQESAERKADKGERPPASS